MNIHKFNVKPKTSTSSNLTIKWVPGRNLKYQAQKVSTTTWKIFSQENILLQPKEVKRVKLGLGFMMSEGVVLVSLSNVLRGKLCSIQNEVNIEDTDDIITILSNNNSKEAVQIREHEALALVCYKKL